MKSIFYIVITLLLLSSFGAQAQEELKVDIETVKDSALLKPYTIDALAPAKASFYAAILPGLGQVYNKQYWKVPLVYGAMGFSLYNYSFNNTEYHKYRDAYKDVLAGRPLTGELADFDADRLIRAQKFHQRNRDLSMLITVGLYALQIIDANVSAHLSQFNVNENLSLKPDLQQNQIDFKRNVAISLNYQF